MQASPRTPSEHRVTRGSGSGCAAVEIEINLHEILMIGFENGSTRQPCRPRPVSLGERCFDLPSSAMAQPPDSRRQHRGRPFDGPCWVLVLGGGHAADQTPWNIDIKKRP